MTSCRYIQPGYLMLDASLDLQPASYWIIKNNVNMDNMDEETFHEIVCDELEHSIKYCHHDRVAYNWWTRPMHLTLDDWYSTFSFFFFNCYIKYCNLFQCFSLFVLIFVRICSRPAVQNPNKLKLLRFTNYRQKFSWLSIDRSSVHWLIFKKTLMH